MFNITSPYKGILLMVVATLLFSRLHSSIKHISSEDILPFEVASVILLAALIGAAMLSRKKVEN